VKLLEIIRDARDHLRENGRVSLRVLRRQFELDDEALDELIEELVDVQRVARREENVLVWAGNEDPAPSAARRPPSASSPASPQSPPELHAQGCKPARSPHGSSPSSKRSLRKSRGGSPGGYVPLPPTLAVTTEVAVRAG